MKRICWRTGFIGFLIGFAILSNSTVSAEGTDINTVIEKLNTLRAQG